MMPDAVDHFVSWNPYSMIAPAGVCLGVLTPDDDADLVAVTRCIAFAGAGILEYIDMSDTQVTVPSGVLAAGALHSIRMKRLTEGTTATTVVGWY